MKFPCFVRLDFCTNTQVPGYSMEGAGYIVKITSR